MLFEPFARTTIPQGAALTRVDGARGRERASSTVNGKAIRFGFDKSCLRATITPSEHPDRYRGDSRSIETPSRGSPSLILHESRCLSFVLHRDVALGVVVSTDDLAPTRIHTHIHTHTHAHTYTYCPRASARDSRASIVLDASEDEAFESNVTE